MTPFERKKPTVQWDEHRREVLCCLYRFFREDHRAFAQIFSEFFKEHLLERGFPQGIIGHQVLYAQWAWMKRQNHDVWTYVHLETEFRTDREWKDVLRIIKALANQLGIPLREKSHEDDYARKKRMKNNLHDSNLRSMSFLSDEEAIDQLVEELDSSSRVVESRSPETTWTPSRRPHELPLRPTPETPTLSNLHLPTKSRYWSRDKAARHQDQIDAPTLIPMSPEAASMLKSPVHEPTDSEEPKETTPCNRTLWGFPCFWCHKDGRVDLDGQQHISMEAAASGSSVQLSDDSPPSPSAIEEQSQLMDDRLLDEQLPDDSKIANSTVLPGLCPPEDLPPILYRWSNVHSQGINSPTQIVAGMFARSNSVAFSPTELDDESFLGFVKSHVTRTPVSSPFISTFKSLLAPIHRALRNGQGAIISIVDSSQVPTEIFKATPLVEITKTALRKWKGYGEYLIWGEVPASAIAHTFTISMLEEIASDHPDIGEFLQLELIRNRELCNCYLYSDLAANLPPSQDGFAEILDRLTGLLGLRGDIKDLVAREFKQTWTEKFLGQKWEKPEDRDPSVSDPKPQLELELASPTVQVFSVRQSRQMSPIGSDCSYIPTGVSEDTSSSTSDSENSEGSEEIAKCPRRDTPSEGYFSLCDDSSEDDWRRPSHVADEDVEMGDGDGGWDSENEWPSDEAMLDGAPIHWAT